MEGLKNLEEVYKKVEKIASWKTKDIFTVEWNESLVIMHNKDSISAWDWARMETWEWKWELSTTITANLFEYLNDLWVKTHYKKQIWKNEILTEKCNMIPIECVFRFVATGSYIKREKYRNWENAIKDWTFLEKPIMELFLKNDVVTENWEIFSDPMIEINNNWKPVIINWFISLLNPKTWENLWRVVVIDGNGEYMSNLKFSVESENIWNISQKLLEETWKVWDNIKDFYDKVWIDTFDWKVEFWYNQKWEIVLADVIDWDSCRLRKTEKFLWKDGKEYTKTRNLDLENLNYDFLNTAWEIYNWLWIERILEAKWVDKDWFRAWESIDKTLTKYAELADASTEALNSYIIEIKKFHD